MVSEILAPLQVSDKPQTILIEGAPGIGKTRVGQGLNKGCYKNTSSSCYQLLIYLRDPTDQKMSTPKQYFRTSFGNNAEKVAVTCSKYFLHRNGRTLAFLLDGYDEIPEELRDC